MKLATFAGDTDPRFGAVRNDKIVDLTDVLGGDVRSIRAVLEAEKLPQLEAWLSENQGKEIPADEISMLPVIPDSQKIICVGLNYAKHVEETGRDSKGYPTIFTRWPDSQIGHNHPLVKPKSSDRFDYEGELAVIIGKSGRHISKEDALDYVAGYSCYNDGSVRDWQRHNIQFTPGKNFPETGGFGPYFVTADEVGDVSNLGIQTRLNGEVMQDANTSMLLFDIPTIISYVSGFTTLAPGDVIASGTPGGVGDKREPPVYMKPGDTVEVEIEKIGLLRNSIELEN